MNQPKTNRPQLINDPQEDKTTSTIKRKDDSPSESSNGITETTLFLSSERFDFEGFVEDDVIIDSIDNANNLFIGFKRRLPTLEQALESMGYEKYKELSEEFLKRGVDKLKEHTISGMTAEEIGTIFCYTYEWDKKKFDEGESPYRKLNNSLSVDRSSKTLKKTRSFLFLLLKTLRKLPRFVPENRMLYRGIKSRVQTEPDPKYPKRKPYAAGNEKTWWTFTSTSMNLETTQDFIRENEGTLFTLSGETWGYDISLFSDFPDEKEILLEPERKLSITNVFRDENNITVDAKILDTPIVLREIINVGKTVTKVIEKKSKSKGVPRSIKIGNVTGSTMELSWDAVDEAVSYHVSSRKSVNSFFNRNLETILNTKETKCIVGNLEQGQEYEFRVRCEFKDGFGEWGGKVIEKTLEILKNVVVDSAIRDSVVITWDPIKSLTKDLISYSAMMKSDKDKDFTEVYSGKETIFTKKELTPNTKYFFKVRAVIGDKTISEWSDLVEFNTVPNHHFIESNNYNIGECPLDSLGMIYPQNYARQTMKQALMEANVSEGLVHRIVENCYKRAQKVKDEGKLFNGFTIDDAAAIAMYTLELGKDNYENAPCKFINKSLINKDDDDIRRTRGILYLVMTALRKLPRVTGRTLYRGLRRRASESDYKEYTIISWYGLSSTSLEMGQTKSFLNDSSSGSPGGTLFMIEKAWGYDISPYSMFPGEKDVLLEPGRQFKVNSVISSELTLITLEMLDTPLWLPDVFGKGRT